MTLPPWRNPRAGPRQGGRASVVAAFNGMAKVNELLAQ